MRKNIKKNFEVLIRLTLIVATFFTSFGFIPTVFATNYANGEIVDATKEVGSTTNPGDVKLQKTLTKAEGDGEYTLTLTVTGKDSIITQSQTAKIYTVVVLDTSGSMDNCFFCWFEDNKYDKAKDGAKAFARQLLTSYPSSEIALVTFDDDVRVTREFRSENFDSTRFPSAGGATNLGGGVAKANELLLAKKASDPNAKLYMVVLGDGYPEGTQTVPVATAAETAHSSGIEVFTIGYDVDQNSAEERVLKSIATDDSHYTNSSGGSIVSDFTDIAGEIEASVPAGTNSIVIDKISEYFDFVPGTASDGVTVDGKNVSLQTGDIIESGKSMSFNIKVKDGLENGVYPTNEYAKVTYIDKNGNEQTLTITDSPKVNVEAYTYTVKYLESGTGKQLHDPKTVPTASAGTTYTENAETISGYNVDAAQKTITVSENNLELVFYYTKKTDLTYTVKYYQDSTSGTLLGTTTVNNVEFETEVKASDIAVNAYKPATGYKDGQIVTSMPYTVIDGENTIEVVYTKKDDLSYTVKYYDDEDNQLSEDNDNTVGNQTYGNQIVAGSIEKNKYKPLLGYQDGVIETTMPYTIVDGENTIVVKYSKRTDMSYTVKYLEQGTETDVLPSETRTGKTFGATYEETAKDAPDGYELVGSNTQNVSIDADNKVVKFYYAKRTDLSYIVSYIDAVTGNELLRSKTRTGKTFGETYEETAETVEGYTVDSNKKSVTITTGTNEIVFRYTKRSDLSYTVNYYKDSTSGDLLGSKTVDNQTFGDLISSDKIDTTLYKPTTGYKDGQIVTTMPYEIKASGNVINVVYEKKTNLTYTVKYYQDSTSGTVLGTTTVENVEFETEVKASDITVNAYKPTTGYKDGQIVTSMPYTVIDGENTIEVVYTKKDDLSYTVKYYDDEDNQLSEDNDNTVGNQTYGNQIVAGSIEKNKYKPLLGYQDGVIETTMPYTIVDGENTIVVKYSKRTDMSYTVKYLEQGTETDVLPSETRTGKTFRATYEETAKEAPYGYELVGSNTQNVSIDADNKVVTFNYAKRTDMKYTVKYLEQGTDKELSDTVTRTEKTYLAEYEEEAVTVKGYNLVGESTVKFTLDKDEKEIVFYYTIKSDLSYRVEYYYDDIIDSSKTETFENITYGTEITGYEAKQPEGYEYVTDTAPITIDDEEENVIKVYYKSIPQGDQTAPNTGIEVKNTFTFAYLISLIGMLFINRKKEEEN